MLPSGGYWLRYMHMEYFHQFMNGVLPPFCAQTWYALTTHSDQPEEVDPDVASLVHALLAKHARKPRPSQGRFRRYRDSSGLPALLASRSGGYSTISESGLRIHPG